MAGPEHVDEIASAVAAKLAPQLKDLGLNGERQHIKEIASYLPEIRTIAGLRPQLEQVAQLAPDVPEIKALLQARRDRVTLWRQLRQLTRWDSALVRWTVSGFIVAVTAGIVVHFGWFIPPAVTP